MFVGNHTHTLEMLDHSCFSLSSVVDCNNAHMVHIEIAPIAFSTFEDFDTCHDKYMSTFCLHNHHAFYDILFHANGDVHKRRRIMMDDVFIYHTHTLFRLSMVCVGTHTPMSTSIEHELKKRALESIHRDITGTPPSLQDDDGVSARSTLFQEGGD